MWPARPRTSSQRFRASSARSSTRPIPVGRQSCIQCHSDNGRVTAGNLVLLEGRSYNQCWLEWRAATRPAQSASFPAIPTNSYLIHKLEGAPDIIGQRMPRTTGPFLTDGQIRIIRRWIEAGREQRLGDPIVTDLVRRTLFALALTALTVPAACGADAGVRGRGSRSRGERLAAGLQSGGAADQPAAAQGQVRASA